MSKHRRRRRYEPELEDPVRARFVLLLLILLVVGSSCAYRALT